MTSIIGRCLVRFRISRSSGGRRALGIMVFSFAGLQSKPEFLGQMVEPKLQRVILMNHHLIQKVSIKHVSPFLPLRMASMFRFMPVRWDANCTY